MVPKTKKVLKKGAFMTDIHFGKKANSRVHNEDCINYLKWFKQQVEEIGDVDYIGFLGDWNENRSAINIDTLNYSYQGAKILDSIGLPVYFIVGNHDLHRRHTRDVHSVIPYQELKNFTIVDEPLVADNIGDGMLWCPYLFSTEYPDLQKYLNIPIWAGHFEFRGFVITGYTITMNTGPDPKDYKGPKHIFSGHFHKRQAHDQVVYIGNTFPMDYGDAGDNARGMMVYDHVEDDVTFIDWDQCPTYMKTTLTALTDGEVKVEKNARVKCIVDIPISFQESQELRSYFLDKFELREFAMEESREISSAISSTESSVSWDDETKLKGVNELIVEMLDELKGDVVDNKLIDKDMLIEIYQGLRT